MTRKQQRQAIYDKFDGKCAYCGCDLNGKFHVDEMQPCRRNYRDERVPGTYKWKRILEGYEHPERLHIDNQMPACASCNINKHSMSLEDFRSLIQGFKKHLNDVSTQFKISKRYGLVIEVDKPVVFYFETVNKHNLTEQKRWPSNR